MDLIADNLMNKDVKDRFQNLIKCQVNINYSVKQNRTLIRIEDGIRLKIVIFCFPSDRPGLS